MTLLGTRSPRIVPFVAAAVLLVVWALRPVAAEDPELAGAETPVAAPYELPDDFLKRVASLPLQDAGRVKPLSTWTGVTLLQMRAMRSMKTNDGRKLGSVAWALEVFFFPERAVKDEIFLIEDDQVLSDLGLAVADKKKRDRYSYQELEPRIQYLKDKVDRVASKLQSGEMSAGDLTLVQNYESNLLRNIRRFEDMLRTLDIVRATIDVSGVQDEAQWFNGRKRVPLVEAFARLPDLRDEMLSRTKDLKEGDSAPPQAKALTRLTAEIDFALREAGSNTTTFAVLPQDQDAAEFPRWLAPANIGLAAHLNPMRWFPEAQKLYGPVRESLSVQMRHLLAAAENRGDRGAFVTHMDAFRDSTVRVAQKRDEFDRVEMEVDYYAFEPFYKALLGFILAFVLLAFTWYYANSRKLYRVTVGLTVISMLLVIIGITWRGLIRQQPPVTTLYDTIPFITATSVLACLIIESINRQRIAIVLAVVLGAAGMWLESRYQYLQPKDTMPELEAVLRTNFWLWVHVTTVTIGYSAGLLAAALGHVHVLGRVFGFKRGDNAYYRNVAKMIYGTLCFGLLFSIFGTIAGGIWANDSWGRFWGWDPKENGALLICLWETSILHGRMGGYLKDHGIAMAAVVTGPVVAFSWWGVNEMQVGLHSYGAIDGVSTALWSFYAFEVAVLVAGGTWWLLRRNHKRAGVL